MEVKRLRALVPFDDRHRTLIHKIKFGKKRWVIKAYRGIIRKACAENAAGGAEMILPIPLDRHRKREREFNQAEDLARLVSECTGAPILTGVIGKRGGKPQSTLKRKERLLNLKGQFYMKRAHRIKDRTVLLVDDVYTTGTTVNECAALLGRAGAREVSALILARTL